MTEPTRMRNDDSSSLIDLVLMSASENLSERVTVSPLANSDHLGISVKLKKYNIHVAREEQSGDMNMLTFPLHVYF